jgi:hypothetical protein
MKEIVIKFIPHARQRRDEIGDWYLDRKGNLQVRITDLDNWRYNVLFARHEMDEAILCMKAGITTEMVDKDDDLASKLDDPDSLSGYPGCCYQQQHSDALASEWQFSRLLGVDWIEYGIAVGRVESRNRKKKEKKKMAFKEKKVEIPGKRGKTPKPKALKAMGEMMKKKKR